MQDEDRSRPSDLERQEYIDKAALGDFVQQMEEKLRDARERKGRRGWHDPEQCAPSDLIKMLLAHIPKGNAGTFLDIANISMMLHMREIDPAELRESFMEEISLLAEETISQRMKHDESEESGV